MIQFSKPVVGENAAVRIQKAIVGEFEPLDRFKIGIDVEPLVGYENPFVGQVLQQGVVLCRTVRLESLEDDDKFMGRAGWMNPVRVQESTERGAAVSLANQMHDGKIGHFR